MEKLKILFVSTTPFEYSSSANMRNVALIKGLYENGHTVYTYTVKPETNSSFYDDKIFSVNVKQKYYLEMDRLYSQFTNKLSEKNKTSSYFKKQINKIYNLVSLYDPRKRLVSNINGNEEILKEKFDLIISSSDPKSSHLFVEKMIRLNPSITHKWIQYWGDPFTLDINKKNIIPRWIVKREEKRILSLADKVIYVSPFTLMKQQEIFPEFKEKLGFYPVPYLNEIKYEDRVNSTFTLGYFGDYYSTDRNIEPLYNAAKNKCSLKIYGNSDVSLESTKTVSVNSRTSIELVRSLEKDCDVLVCVCNKRGTQIPGKIYHYAATNKPILIIIDGDNQDELKEYLESYNRFFICGNNEKSISTVLDKIRNSDIKFSPCLEFNSRSIASEFIKNL